MLLSRVLLPAILCAVMAAPALAQASISITEAIAAASARFSGEVIAADLGPARPNEGTGSVYSLRLLSPNGDIIEVRVDAASGQIIEVNGRGLVEARKSP